MRNWFRFLGCCLIAFAAVNPLSSFAQDAEVVPADAVAGPPDATFEFEARQVRLLLGGGAGSGVLHFKGKDYPFTMKAATVGGVGVTDVAGTGSVHGLTKVEDFAGNYAAVGIGAALVKGKGASSFRNSKGVIVSTKSKSTGVAMNLGVGGVAVTLNK